jgi:hypothetical protein
MIDFDLNPNGAGSITTGEIGVPEFGQKLTWFRADAFMDRLK